MAPFLALLPLLTFPLSLADNCESNDCAAASAPSVDLLQRKLQVNGTGALQRSRPNLLFIVLDQWRWDWTGLESNVPLRMPTLKALAAQGVRFTRAYTPSPQCVPARSALAQVREYKDSWVKNNSDLTEKQMSPNLTTTFMSALQDVGYTTMVVGKDHLFYLMSPLIPESEEREYMQSIGVDHYHRTTDKYNFCSSDLDLEDLDLDLEALGLPNTSNTSNTSDKEQPMLVPIDGYGMSLNQTEGLFEKQCAFYGSLGFPEQHREGTSCRKTPVFDRLSVTENGFRCHVSNPLDEVWSPDAWVRRKAVELLQQHHQRHQQSKPWFLQVNFLGPHPPFIVKPSSEQLMKELEGQLPPPIDAEKKQMLVFDDDGPKLLPYNKTYVNSSASRLQYAALLHQIDGEIKEILEALSEMGAMDNTIIAIAGDHGEHLGDHGHFGKCSPFESAAHVPLIVAGAALPLKGVEEHRPVSLIDVPATFLDLAGAPLAPSMQGYSFLPALSGGSMNRPAVMFGMNSWEVPWEAGGYSPGIVQFDAAAALFGDSFLKLICCPHGCRKGGTLLPTPLGFPQVALMNVTAGTGKHRFEHDILNQPPGHGVAEALYLATFLADEFREVCEPLLTTPSPEA